jgi:hypothetical protein
MNQDHQRNECMYCGAAKDPSVGFCYSCGRVEAALEQAPLNFTPNTNLFQTSSSVFPTLDLPYQQPGQIQSAANFPPNPQMQQPYGNQFPINHSLLEYDDTYDSDNGPIVVGIMGILIVIILNFWGVRDANDYFILMGVLLVARFFALAWVYSLCKKKNRDLVAPCIFAFLSPMITLIVVGAMKRKMFSTDFHTWFYQKKSDYCLDMAVAHYNKHFYEKAKMLFSMAEGLFPFNTSLEEVRKDIMTGGSSIWNAQQ